MDPLLLKLMDKDDTLGQITLHMHELPTAKPVQPKSVPLQPHKKCPKPQGELVFEAWITKYTDEAPVAKGKSKSKSKEKTLSDQMSQLKGGAGSRESMGSTISGFSTMSEATKKKSKFKKLKGAFKHSPKPGRHSMADKTSVQSCMDLTYSDRPLSLQAVELKGSQESLASQKSEKKSRNLLKLFKSKKEKEGGMSKKNSSSLHNLALPDAAGSSESLDKLGKSRMGGNFPGKFDLTAPTALIAAIAEEERQEQKKKLEEEEWKQEPTPPKTPTHLEPVTPASSASPKVSQRRRLSQQTRSLRDDPRLRNIQSSPLSSRHMFSTSPNASMRAPVRAPAIGSSSENVSARADEQVAVTSPRTSRFVSDSDAQSIHSNASSSYDQEFVGGATPYLPTTPTSKKKLTTDSLLPEVTGVSPAEGSVIGGTKLTIRGSNLGLDQADVVCVNVCGANCLSTLEYVSDRKLVVVTKPWKEGSGRIIVETQSGGRAKSLVEFTFVEEPQPKDDDTLSTDDFVLDALTAPVLPPLSPELSSSPANPFESSSGFNFADESNPFAADVKAEAKVEKVEEVERKRTPPAKPHRVAKAPSPTQARSPAEDLKKTKSKKRFAPEPKSKMSESEVDLREATEVDATSSPTARNSSERDTTTAAAASADLTWKETPAATAAAQSVFLETLHRQDPEGMTTAKEAKSAEPSAKAVCQASHIRVL